MNERTFKERGCKWLCAFLVMAIVFPAIMIGCTTTTSTTTDPTTGTTTTTEAYNLNTDQIASVANLATSVWSTISAAQAAADAQEATTSTTTTTPTLSETVSAITSIISSLNGTSTSKGHRSFTEAGVTTQATKIALMAFREAGRFPSSDEVAIYVAKGTLPSEAALIAFKGGGKLSD